MATNEVKRARYAARKAAGVTIERQVCRSCQADKLAVEFRNNWHQPGGLELRCRSCVSDRDRAARFDMTATEYQAKLEEQGHVCAICRRPETTTGKSGRVKALAVDHNHATNVKRGLLCANCNKGIGNLGDSAETLIAAAAYLMEYAADGGVI